MDKKKSDLEERSFFFARDCSLLVKKIKMDVSNIEDCKQLVRSFGLIVSNYIEIEANRIKNL